MVRSWIPLGCLIKEATVKYLVVDPHSEPYLIAIHIIACGKGVEKQTKK